MLDLVTDKVHDETRQGEAYAPFANDPTAYRKRFYIESYGCAMNFADSEVVASILNKEGFGATRNVEEADLIFVNTCSIREKAEQTVRKRLTEFRKLKKARPGTVGRRIGLYGGKIEIEIPGRRKTGGHSGRPGCLPLITGIGGRSGKRSESDQCFTEP